MTDEERYRYLKTNSASLYGSGFYSNLAKILRRIRDCYHICLWCKYRHICDISWCKYK